MDRCYDDLTIHSQAVQDHKICSDIAHIWDRPISAPRRSVLRQEASAGLLTWFEVPDEECEFVVYCVRDCVDVYVDRVAQLMEAGYRRVWRIS
jgi:hypothetical protein